MTQPFIGTLSLSLSGFYGKEGSKAVQKGVEGN